MMDAELSGIGGRVYQSRSEESRRGWSGIGFRENLEL